MRRFALIVPLLLAFAVGASAADRMLPNHLVNAKPGEWVVMRDIAGDNAGEFSRFIILERKGEGDDAVVTMRRERLNEAGEVTESRDFDINLARHAKRLAELEDKAKQISREHITINDKTYNVYAVTWDHEGKDGQVSEMKMWVSDEIPGGGMVKIWSSNPNFPAAELVDSGVVAPQ